MRIHSDIITSNDLVAAKNYATSNGYGNVHFLELSRHNSRKRDHAFEVRLEGDGTTSRRRINQGTTRFRAYGDEVPFAATWQQWGWFLAHLFMVDPNMDATYYKGEEDFHARTKGEFLIHVSV